MIRTQTSRYATGHWLGRFSAACGFFCVFLVTLLLTPTAEAAPERVLILASKDAPVYRTLIKEIELHSELSQIDFIVRFDPASLEDTPRYSYDLIVAIGADATRWSMEKTNLPVLSTFIPRQTYLSLEKDALNIPENTRKKGDLSGLFLEQPYQRHLQLIAQLKPHTKHLGTLFGPSSSADRPLLQQTVKEMGWTFHHETLVADDNTLKKLTPIMAASDAFLAIPDRAIFNRNTAKWILLMSFRQGIPLIAYSKRYVEAGALAAVYSTPETVGQETAQWVKKWLQNNHRLPVATYPTLFDLSINEGTADSLGMQLPPANTLKQRLQQP